MFLFVLLSALDSKHEPCTLHVAYTDSAPLLYYHP